MMARQFFTTDAVKRWCSIGDLRISWHNKKCCFVTTNLAYEEWHSTACIIKQARKEIPPGCAQI